MCLVEGWHLTYLFSLVAASHVVNICVIVIVTLDPYVVFVGLAVASYIIGVVTAC